ncbi:MAG: DUF4886 domain-containing protein [Clostridia bacterium]|nr:DUF4886 domain-containing protein [Clostridia bacterium]
MKKITSLLALILAFAMLLVACGGNTPAVTTDPTQSTSGTTESSTTATTTPETPKEPKTLKVLAIGNSFSVDAMEHLWNILMRMGYDDVFLGNLYIGGCSIDTHWGNIRDDLEAYEYHTNDMGAWKKKPGTKLSTALLSQEWDVITIQQVSQNSGMPETMGNLQNILDYVKANMPNKDAKIYWHMTWAYQQNTTHSGFPNYGSNQMNMYNAITGAVESTIKTNKDIDGFIPSGTTIQNMRTSYLGDTLTRDGYHLSEGLGRYAAAMTWAKYITGESIDNITWVPVKFKSEIAPYLDIVKEAVNNAYKTPLAVTNSTYTKNPNGEPEKPETPELPTVVTDLSITEALTDADKAVLTAQGLDPAKYAVLKLNNNFKAFYNSTSTATTLTKSSSNGDTGSKFVATSIFTKEQLPGGSIITIAEGYQYRPEGWQQMGVKNNKTRPSEVKTSIVKVDAKWWEGYELRAFNVSTNQTNLSDRQVVTDEAMTALRIYVPIAK